jgi:hypothetical protein
MYTAVVLDVTVIVATALNLLRIQFFADIAESTRPG